MLHRFWGEKHPDNTQIVVLLIVVPPLIVFARRFLVASLLLFWGPIYGDGFDWV